MNCSDTTRCSLTQIRVIADLLCRRRLVRNQVTGVVGVLVWMLAVKQIVIPAFPAVGRWMPEGATPAFPGRRAISAHKAWPKTRGDLRISPKTAIGGGRGAGRPDLAEATVEVAHSGLRHHATGSSAGVDRAVGADRGARAGAHQPAWPGCRSASSASSWASQAVDLADPEPKLTTDSEATWAAGPWLRRSYRVLDGDAELRGELGEGDDGVEPRLGECRGLHTDQVR